MLNEQGVDAIITNKPVIAKKVISINEGGSF